MDELIKPIRDVQLSYAEAQNLRTESIWSSLSGISVERALDEWLWTLGAHTRRNYRSGMNRLIELGFLDPTKSLQQFSMVSHSVVVDRIKLVDDWTEATKQARAACYISFTRFLHRRTDGVIIRAEPCREGTAKTFYKVREKVATRSLTRAQWMMFFQELEKTSPRNALIGKLALQGGKRIGEVLAIRKENIDVDSRRIRYSQSKTKGTEKTTLITYSEGIIQSLLEYIRDREGLVFVTRNGRPVSHPSLYRSFVKAGTKAKIPFKVTPHVMRASCVTYLKSQGFSDSDIMAVTGHASAEMIFAYDKRDEEDNISSRVHLV